MYKKRTAHVYFDIHFPQIKTSWIPPPPPFLFFFLFSFLGSLKNAASDMVLTRPNRETELNV